MTNRANFDSLGNDFSVRFGLEDLSGRAKSNLLTALLREAGVMEDITSGSEVEAILNKAISNLWSK